MKSTRSRWRYTVRHSTLSDHAMRKRLLTDVVPGACHGMSQEQRKVLEAFTPRQLLSVRRQNLQLRCYGDEVVTM